MRHWIRSSECFRAIISGWLLSAFLLQGQAPSWWQTRGVIRPELAANDYGLVNQGQLKHIARKAYQEMEGKLVGGAGSALDAKLESWNTPSPQTDDYAVVTVGQVKNLALLYYDRLIEAGAASSYPWTVGIEDDNDYGAANIGQVKHLFAFTVPDQRPDKDQDGIPDDLELSLGMNPSNPWDKVPGSPPPDNTWGGNEGGGTGFQQGATTLLAQSVVPTAREYATIGAISGDWEHESTTLYNDGTPPSSSSWSLIKLLSNELAPFLAGGNNSYGDTDGTYVHFVASNISTNSGASKTKSKVRFIWSGGAPEQTVLMLDQVTYRIDNGVLVRVQAVRTHVIFEKEQTESTSLVFSYPSSNHLLTLQMVRDTPGWSVSIHDAGGPSHRKIDLNGHPLPDASPERQPETDTPPEETFVDALNAQLQHRVSDVYVPLGASLLNLDSSRFITAEVWSRRYGLRPDERLDKPFGVCWGSNLCSYVKLVRGTNEELEVVDEAGQSMRFVKRLSYDPEEGNHTNLGWFPSREERNSAKSSQNRITEEIIGGTGYYVLRKKYGTTCYFSKASAQKVIEPSAAHDRFLDGSPRLGGSALDYCRLTSVKDSQGNELRYEYPGNYTLIPSKIFDPKRPAAMMWTEQDEHGQVTRLRWPGGQDVTFHYTDVQIDDFPEPLRALERVQKGNASVLYAYEVVREIDPTPRLSSPRNFRYHANVTKITGENGHDHSFAYEFNHQFQFREISEDGDLWRTQIGMPRRLTTISLPGGTNTDFSVNRNLQINENQGLGNTTSVTTVSGPGGAFNYHFLDAAVWQPVPDEEAGLVTGLDPDHPMKTWASSTLQQLERSRQLVLYYTTMEIQSAEGKEIFEFNFNAGMALSSAKDLSGNTTRYEYGDLSLNDPGWNEEFYYWYTEPPVYYDTQVKDPVDFYFDDPTKVTNALSQNTLHTYNAATRLRHSTTTPGGVRHEREIDESKFLVTGEKVFSSGGQAELMSHAEYVYANSTFPGFMTARIVHPVPRDPQDFPGLRVEFVPDGNGRVCDEATVMGVTKRLVTSYDYDLNGKKRFVTSPRGHITEFVYNDQQRLREVIHPGGAKKTFDYDLAGNIKEETNENNITSVHTYDNLNRRTKTEVAVPQDETGRAAHTVSTSRTYNGRNQVDTETDARGTVTKYFYDVIGRRRSTITAHGTPEAQTTSFDYVGNFGGSLFDLGGFKPTKVSGPRPGVKADIVYDKLYRPRFQTTTDGGTTETRYDLGGNPHEVVDALNRITTTEHDALGRPEEVEHPDDTTTETHHTSTGLVWKSVDELGKATEITYDAAGRPVTVAGPAVDDGSGLGQMVRPTTHHAYDAGGNLIAVRNPLGYITSTEYDSRNRPVKVKGTPMKLGALGALAVPVTATQYDDVGNVIKITDPLNHITQQYYDGLNRLVKVRDALQHTSTTRYDDNGNAVKVTDQMSHDLVNEYDRHNRLVSTLDAEDQTTSFGYDEAGNRTRVTDGRNAVTTFEYDGMNRLEKEQPPVGSPTTHTYNELQKKTSTDGRSQVTTYETYDERDRLKTVNLPGGVTRTFGYDAVGRLLSVAEAGRPQAAVSYTYDDLGRQASETARGVTHHHLYDVAGNRVRTSHGGGRVVLTHHDPAGRVIGLEQGGRRTRWYHDLGGRCVGHWQGNGQWTENHYDALGRLTNRVLWETVEKDAVGFKAGFVWVHNAVGGVIEQRESWSHRVPGRPGGLRITSMIYDDVDRLTGEAVAEPDGTLRSTGYGYDEAGNRVAKTERLNGVEQSSVSYVHNELNQLTGWTETDGGGSLRKSCALGYDDAGNRVSESLTLAAGGAAQLRLFAWDRENHLEKVTLPGGAVHSYEYDYRTRRISRKEGGTVTGVVFSGGLSAAEYPLSTMASPVVNPAAPKVEYQRGPDMGGGVGGLLYSLRQNLTMYNLCNSRGDVVAQSNGAGGVWWNASYEGFGKRTVETGTNLDRQRANSKEEDPTGLLNEGFRYRDLETGTWLSRDPAGFIDGPNVYAYVRQNPWSKFDPLGLSEQRPGIFEGLWTLAKETFGPVQNEPKTDIGKINKSLRDLADFSGVVPGPITEKRREDLRRSSPKAAEISEFLENGFSQPGIGGIGMMKNVPKFPKTSKAVTTITDSASTITKNVEQGAAAEALVTKQLVEEGRTILGQRVSVNTSEGRRVLDNLVEDAGTVVNIEVKSGNATRNASQIAKDNAMATEGGIPVGKNAPINLNGQRLIIPTEVRQVSKEELSK